MTAQVPHLIEMFHLDADHSLKTRLHNGSDLPALQILPQKHAESRCLHRGRAVFRNEATKRKGCIGAEEKSHLTSAALHFRLYGQDDLILVGLGDAADASAENFLFDLVPKAGDCDSVECHADYLQVCKDAKTSRAGRFLQETLL